MPFATGPVLAYIGLGRYKTVGPTVYVGADDVITIPDGFTTDLASVPRIFWAVLPPTGVYERAAVLHDYGCSLVRAGSCVMTARDVDGLFRRVVRECGGGLVVRWILWAGVRWGALTEPPRRAGWWRDFPLLAAVSAAIVAVIGGAVYGLARFLQLIS